MSITGKDFQGTLLYIQRVKSDFECSEITVPELLGFISTQDKSAEPFRLISTSAARTADGRVRVDNNLMFMSSLNLEITDLRIYSVPLTTEIQISPFIHTFIVFRTVNKKKKKEMWWSLEKLTDYIVLQQSRYESQVRDIKWDTKEQIFVNRFENLEKVKHEIEAKCQAKLKDLWDLIVKERILIDPYHFLCSNCQKFASYIFNKLNKDGIKWKAPVNMKRLTIDPTEKIKFKIEKIGINDFILSLNDKKRRDAIMEIINENQDSEKSIQQLSIMELDNKQINSRDRQGYTLLEWAKAFERHDIKDYLIGKGATKNDNFLRNVFFIALQYRNSVQGNSPAFEGVDYKGQNDMGDTALHLALYGMDNTNKKTNVIEQLLDKDCDVVAVNERKETPLHLAVKLKCPRKTFEKILMKSLRVINDGDLSTALHYAIEAHSKKKTMLLLNKLFLDKGAGDIHDSGGETPLHIAAKLNCPAKILKQILTKFFFENFPHETLTLINQGDKYGLTPLHYAIYTHSKKKTKLLLDNKASVDLVTKDFVDGQTLLHLAAKWWNDCPSYIIKKLVEGGNIDKLDVRNFTALQLALESKNDKVSQILLQYGASVEISPTSPCPSHLAPIFLASKWPNIPKALAEKIITTLQNQNYNTTKSKNYRIRKEKKRQKFINAFDTFGYTPLHWTLKAGSLKMSQLLLNNGADPCETTGDTNGDTALHLIARFRNNGNKKCFKLTINKLCTVAVDTTIPSKESQCEDAGTTRNESNQITKRFIKLNKKGYSPLHTAIESNNLFAAKEFLMACKDEIVNLTTEVIARKKAQNDAHIVIKRTPLHLAAGNPRVSLDMVKFLIENKANIEAVDSHGFTPLVWALKAKSDLKADYLLNKGANVNVDMRQIANKKTPIHLALHNWKNCPLSFFEKLLENWPNDRIDEKDSHGYTPLHTARHYQMEDHARLLLEKGATPI